MTVEQRRFSVPRVALLVLILVIGIGVGAYLDWIWWHPAKGIVITLVAIGLLLVAAVVALLRRRLTRKVALVAAVAGIGLLVGQLLGPQRPSIGGGDGSMTIRLDTPVAVEATGVATCQSEVGGDQLQVSGDMNTRLPLPGVEPVAQPFISASASIGDRWELARPRDDDLAVLILLGAAVEDASGGPGEVRFASTPSSSLSLSRDGNDGTLTFASLAVDGGSAGILGVEGELSGALEWSCP